MSEQLDVWVMEINSPFGTDGAAVDDWSTRPRDNGEQAQNFFNFEVVKTTNHRYSPIMRGLL